MTQEFEGFGSRRIGEIDRILSKVLGVGLLALDHWFYVII